MIPMDLSSDGYRCDISYTDKWVLLGCQRGAGCMHINTLNLGLGPSSYLCFLDWVYLCFLHRQLFPIPLLIIQDDSITCPFFLPCVSVFSWVAEGAVWLVCNPITSQDCCTPQPAACSAASLWKPKHLLHCTKTVSLKQFSGNLKNCTSFT